MNYLQLRSKQLRNLFAFAFLFLVSCGGTQEIKDYNVYNDVKATDNKTLIFQTLDGTQLSLEVKDLFYRADGGRFFIHFTVQNKSTFSVEFYPKMLPYAKLTEEKYVYFGSVYDKDLNVITKNQTVVWQNNAFLLLPQKTLQLQFELTQKDESLFQLLARSERIQFYKPKDGGWENLSQEAYCSVEASLLLKPSDCDVRFKNPFASMIVTETNEIYKACTYGNHSCRSYEKSELK